MSLRSQKSKVKSQNPIQFSNADVKFVLKQKAHIKEWIEGVIASKKKNKGDLSFIFCSDEYLLQINGQFLQHNTYTDIITFDYTEGKNISGEIYISIDRVKENAQKFDKSFDDELHRVMIHGVLHLLGFKDKTKADKEKMRKEEDKALRELSTILSNKDE